MTIGILILKLLYGAMAFGKLKGNGKYMQHMCLTLF